MSWHATNYHPCSRSSGTLVNSYSLITYIRYIRHLPRLLGLGRSTTDIRVPRLALEGRLHRKLVNSGQHLFVPASEIDTFEESSTQIPKAPALSRQGPQETSWGSTLMSESSARLVSAPDADIPAELEAHMTGWLAGVSPGFHVSVFRSMVRILLYPPLQDQSVCFVDSYILRPFLPVRSSGIYQSSSTNHKGGSCFASKGQHWKDRPPECSKPNSCENTRSQRHR